MSEPINEECVGPSSDIAGKASSCAGCPNQAACSSGAGKVVDPAVAHIVERVGLIKNKLLILSGKGGVGKSTVSAQLAFTLALQGYEVGLLDIDICGPSVPRMLGLSGHEVHQSSVGWSPVYVKDNLGVMSIGFMLPNQDDAVIWRGPRKNGLIKQFLSDVDWGSLDYLIIDTPPGTSDEHISIVQYLMSEESSKQGVGAVIVTTPQEVAMADVRKELNFCKKTGLPVYGIIENMADIILPLGDPRIQFIDSSGINHTSTIINKLNQVCPELSTISVKFPFFSTINSMNRDLTGPMQMAANYNTDYLGAVPMDNALLTCGEEGKSVLEAYPDSIAARYLNTIVNKIVTICQQRSPIS